MMNYSQPPNWVKGRADCNLDLTFEALIQIVTRDVAEANQLHAEGRSKRRFRIESNDAGTRPLVKVEQVDGESDGTRPQVLFEMSETAIRVNGAGVAFFVQPQWDGTACRLHVDGADRPSELWRISQRALSRLFFG